MCMELPRLFYSRVTNKPQNVYMKKSHYSDRSGQKVASESNLLKTGHISELTALLREEVSAQKTYNS